MVSSNFIVLLFSWKDLNAAHQSFARLHSGFFGMPHMFSIVRLLGSRSLPWLIRALLDHISTKVCHAMQRSVVQTHCKCKLLNGCLKLHMFRLCSCVHHVVRGFSVFLHTSFDIA